jgi:hypothetical protein
MTQMTQISNAPKGWLIAELAIGDWRLADWVKVFANRFRKRLAITETANHEPSSSLQKAGGTWREHDESASAFSLR